MTSRDAVPAQQRDLVGEEGMIEERHHRLGAAQGERPQPRALAAGQDDGLGPLRARRPRAALR